MWLYKHAHGPLVWVYREDDLQAIQRALSGWQAEVGANSDSEGSAPRQDKRQGRPLSPEEVQYRLRTLEDYRQAKDHYKNLMEWVAERKLRGGKDRYLTAKKVEGYMSWLATQRKREMVV